jgi:hypothetical protein
MMPGQATVKAQLSALDLMRCDPDDLPEDFPLFPEGWERMTGEGKAEAMGEYMLAISAWREDHPEVIALAS